MTSFAVDDVAPAAEVLPARPLGELFKDALAVGGDPGLAVLAPDGVHPLLSAVARAFAGHRPLVLSPDAVWLTIAQGVAQHVRLHAEELRPLLVSHAGRKRLEVIHDGAMPEDAESWRGFVGAFAGRLGGEIAFADLFACDFSTSTDVERVAGQIVLLDAYSPYYSAWLECVCGIPSITLTGTVDDWRSIWARVDALDAFGLERWQRSLKPIADQFIVAAKGYPDIPFWQRIYNPVDAYGGDATTGWAARLYPYLERSGAVDAPNPLLDLPIGLPRDATSPSIRTYHVPATLSQVIVNVGDHVAGEHRTVALRGGLVAVAQDDDGALRPVAGWHLTEAEPQIEDVIERIVRDHVTTPPTGIPMPLPVGELSAIYRRIGSATLFGGAWRLRPAEAHGIVDADGMIAQVIDLPDDGWIGVRFDEETLREQWVTDGRDLGSSLAALLTAALDSGGSLPK